MDPYSAHAIATTRSADLVREAEQARIAKAARESREDERPAPAPGPARRPARVRRLGVAR